MISENKSIKEIIKFLFKEKKFLIILLIFSIMSLSFITYEFVVIFNKQKDFVENKLIEDYQNILNTNFDEIVKKLNHFEKSIPKNFFNILIYENLSSHLKNFPFANYLIILPDLNQFEFLNKEDIKLEKNLREYKIYEFAIKAFENGKFDLSISYLLPLLNNSKDKYPFITLKSYLLLIRDYYSKGKLETAKYYTQEAIFYVYNKKVISYDFLHLLEWLFNLELSPSVKKMIALQLLTVKYIYFPDYKFSTGLNFYINLYFFKEKKFLASKYFPSKLLSYMNFKSSNLIFIDWLNKNNFLFEKKIEFYSTNFYLIYSIDLFKIIKNLNNNSHYYFNISINNLDIIENKENYSLFNKLLLPFSYSSKLYLKFYIENSKLVEYIAKSQYMYWTFGFIFVVLIILITIIILTYVLIKEFQLNQLKSDFISIVSHELKTPITTIQLVIETLLRNYENVPKEKKISYLKKIFAETERLLYLINNLLTFSRNEKKKIVYNFQPVNINELIMEVVEFFKISKKNVNFVLDFSENNIIINIDKGAFKQVIYNILDNSYKYSGEEKIITIRLKKSKNKLNVIFKDNGFGMSPEELKLVFEKFFRGNETQAIPGTGLGLTLIKNIVESHGGKINIESKKGEGTQISIILPLNN